MSQKPKDTMKQTLAQAQETIALQNRQIASLQQQLEREHFAQELRKLLISTESVMTILSPFSHSHVLEMVVVTASQVISAHAGSLYLLDPEAQELIFEVAIGPAGQDVKKFRVPLGHGIAGMVAMTGQPMAVADAEQDEHFAIDIATSVKYIPKSILCVPLFYDDQIIGALELLDKIDADTFSFQDMETLGLFAHIAAVAIAQSQTFHDRQSLLQSLLSTLHEKYPKQLQGHQPATTNFFTSLQVDDTFSKTARELASLVHILLLSGEQQSEMCKNVLQSFVASSSSRERDYATSSTLY